MNLKNALHTVQAMLSDEQISHQERVQQTNTYIAGVLELIEKSRRAVRVNLTDDASLVMTSIDGETWHNAPGYDGAVEATMEVDEFEEWVRQGAPAPSSEQSRRRVLELAREVLREEQESVRIVGNGEDWRGHIVTIIDNVIVARGAGVGGGKDETRHITIDGDTARVDGVAGIYKPDATWTTRDGSEVSGIEIVC